MADNDILARSLVFEQPLQVKVRPMLRDCCPVCPVCLSVMLVYYGQTVGLIRKPLGMKVGLGPGNIVLDGIMGTELPPRKGAQQPPALRPMSIVIKWLDGSVYHLLWR